MKIKSGIFNTFGAFSKLFGLTGVLLLCACAGSNNGEMQMTPIATPTVDYIESLDVYSAPHKDSFLNQLAMNYRSFAIYNARTSGYSEMGELFAQKSVAAFSGEVPFPESLENWPIEDEAAGFELHTAYTRLIGGLQNDIADTNPIVAAEAQAKFDCWLSASASNQPSTARECHDRFEKAMAALNCDGKTVGAKSKIATNTEVRKSSIRASEVYYPETRNMTAMQGAGMVRDGVIIVNNVNIPNHLINPVPVQPMVFNQNIYSSGKTCTGVECDAVAMPTEIPVIGEELVSRDEFINMMMAMRSELAAINARLDKIQTGQNERTMIKVQQIPLEPKQHVMEEIFEVRFDFDKSTIKPEYQQLIQKLVAATTDNKNIKVSVIGHTDTSGSASYNYALGGERATAVQKMLIKYGIPASQIVSVSAGEKDNKVPTGDGVPNAENRRVRVVKEVHYTQPSQKAMAIEVEEYSTDGSCGEYGCVEN